MKRKDDDLEGLFNDAVSALHMYIDTLLELPQEEEVKWYVQHLRGVAKRISNLRRGEIGDRSEVMRELAARGGLRGGPARAKLLTPEQRKAIARIAAKARWAKK